MGGLDELAGSGGVSLVGSGTLDLSTQMQGTHPDRPDLVPVEESLAVDLEGGRVAWETHARVNPDADEWIRYLHDDQGRMLIVLRSSGQAFWVPGDDDHKRRYERSCPISSSATPSPAGRRCGIWGASRARRRLPSHCRAENP